MWKYAAIIIIINHQSGSLFPEAEHKLASRFEVKEIFWEAL